MGICAAGTRKSRRGRAPRPRRRGAAMSDVHEVLEWLAGGALSGPESQDVLAQLCERMVQAGIPLWRVAVFVTTLHPDVMGRSFRWQAESGVTVSEALHSFKETD